MGECRVASRESHRWMQWDRLAVMLANPELRQTWSSVCLHPSFSLRSRFGHTGWTYASCLLDWHTSDPPPRPPLLRLCWDWGCSLN